MVQSRVSSRPQSPNRRKGLCQPNHWTRIRARGTTRMAASGPATQPQQLLAVLYQGTGHQQQKMQDQQHQQRGLAINPIEPGSVDKPHQGGSQGGATAEIAGLFWCHAEADHQVRPEGHHHHHGAHGEHVDKHCKVNGGWGSGYRLHRRQARRMRPDCIRAITAL